MVGCWQETRVGENEDGGVCGMLGRGKGEMEKVTLGMLVVSIVGSVGWSCEKRDECGVSREGERGKGC
jgi:hypothetical protein